MFYKIIIACFAGFYCHVLRVITQSFARKSISKNYEIESQDKFMKPATLALQVFGKFE